MAENLNYFSDDEESEWLACWIINLLIDVLLCSIAENFYSFVRILFVCLFDTTRKNTLRYYTTKRLIRYLALINRAGGLNGRILTEVVSTDRTQ